MNSKSVATRYIRNLSLIGCLLSLFLMISIQQASATPNHIEGQVFLDANGDGRKTAPGYINERGAQGATVTAFNANGESATDTSDENGNYSIDISTLGSGPFRVELSVPSGYTSAPTGLATQSSVRQQIQAGSTGVDFGILDPTQYCSANPRLVVSCFSNGDPKKSSSDPKATLTRSASKSFRFDDEGYPGQHGFNPAREVTKQSQVGSVFGVAYSRATGSLYESAFLRRHAGFGPGSTGAIYVINPTTNAVTGTITIANTGSEPTARDLPAVTYGPSRDIDAYSKVGKIALGDIDVVGDGTTLFATNLNTRQLVRVDGLNTTPGQKTFSLPSSVTCPGGEADRRPFGLGSRTLNGKIKLYVGVTCTGETDKTIASTQGKVVEFDVATNTWGDVQLTVPFNTPKGCAIKTTLLGQKFDLGCAWSAWNDNPDAVQKFDLGIAGLLAGVGQFHLANPQPVVADVEFDQTGAMVVGIADRGGWQWGHRNYGPYAATAGDLDPQNSIYTGYSAGDQLRACAKGSTFVLENNGSCGGITTLGAGNNEGPGGGEYYWGDESIYDNGTLSQGHEELSLGGLAFVPGRTTMAATATDPFFTIDGKTNLRGNATGLVKLAHIDDTSINAKAGGWTGAFEIGNLLDGTNDFAKAGGLGDLEVLCENAPLEIGNFIWFDTNKNGIQDPNETPLEGVSVSLVDNATGKVIANAKTDAQGHYIFASEGAGNIVALGVDGPNPGDDNTNDAYGIVRDPSGNLGDGDYGIKTSHSYSVLVDPSTTVISNTLKDQGVTSSADLKLTVADKDSGTNSDLRDSDGKDVNGVVTITVNTGSAGENNHTFDVGFYAGPVPPTVPPTEPPTVPPTEPPTVPPTEPPTVPPTEPPTVPPTVTQPPVTVQGTTVVQVAGAKLPMTGNQSVDLTIYGIMFLLFGLITATLSFHRDSKIL